MSIVQCSLSRMAKVLITACPHLYKVMLPQLLEIMESGPNWISAHVLRYIDEGISCVHLFNFLISWSFSILAPVSRLVGHYCRHCNGVLLCQFANKYWICAALFSRLYVIARSWIVFVAGYWIVLHTYLKIIYIFIGVEPYDYIYSSCSYIVCCPQLCDFSHQKRISGDKI